MLEYINKYLKKYIKLIFVSIIASAAISLILYRKVGIKTSLMVFAALFCLIINIFLIYVDKRKSIMLFLALLPLYTTVRRVCYFDILFVRVTFETIYITILSLSSVKDLFNTLKCLLTSKEKISFNFILLIIFFLLLCINSSSFSVSIMRGLSEVYIGVLTPIMLMLCFITYFTREDKYNIYYILIGILDFSCLYGFVQLLSHGISLSQIKYNKIYMTFGYNNVNIFAGILISVFPLLAEMILYKKNSKNEKLFLYLSFILYTVSFLITFSRGAWLCYIAVIFMILCHKRYKKILIIMLIPALLMAKPVFNYIINRGTATTFLKDESAVARIQSIFTDGIIMKNYPFGIGGGNFAVAYKKFALQGYLAMPESIRFNSTAAHYTLEHAHNLLLQIGVEFGIIAALIFIFIIINRLKAAAKNFSFNRGAFISVLIFSAFSLITGSEFNHKGVITGTLIIFVIFAMIELSLKSERS